MSMRGVHNNPEERTEPALLPRTDTGLGRCLVEGDPEETSQARRSRRTTFGLSLAVEILLLGVLVAAPLLTSVAQPKISRPTLAPFVFGGSSPNRHIPRPVTPTPQQPNYHDGRITYITSHPVASPFRPTADPEPPETPILDIPTGDAGSGGNRPFLDLWPAIPLAPPQATKRNTEAHPLKLSEPIVAAQLISRIEPRYPPLALQLRKTGTVVLHAIIGRDGQINALEILSGSPYFVQAALDAVRQWRYRPTLLNGEPVQVETTITVIFQLQP